MRAAIAQTASLTAAILRPGRPLADGEAHFTAVVDGVVILATFDYRKARLACRLRENPLEEDELRELLGRFLRYTDRGDELVCIEPDGALVLLLDLQAGDELEEQVARFCDAAVFWYSAAACSSKAGAGLISRATPQIIYP
jgi:hypothetical protein